MMAHHGMMLSGRAASTLMGRRFWPRARCLRKHDVPVWDSWEGHDGILDHSGEVMVN